MTDEQKILLALVKLMFPREMLDYFEVVGFELQEAYGNSSRLRLPIPLRLALLQVWSDRLRCCT